MTKQTEVFQELTRHKTNIHILTETVRKGIATDEIEVYIQVYNGVDKNTRAKRGASIAIHKRFTENVKREEIHEQTKENNNIEE